MLFSTGLDQGKEGLKQVTIFYLPGLRRWWLIRGPFTGTKIEIIPSQDVLIKTFPAPIKDPRRLRKFIQSELLLRYPDRRLLWGFKRENDQVQVIIVEAPGESFTGALEPEPLALARVFLACGLKDGYVLDIGRSKTTLVEMKEGRLFGFRCRLKGCDYVDQMVAQRKGLRPEEAETLRQEVGLEDEDIKYFFQALIPSLEPGRPVLVTGGGAKTKGLPSLFPKNDLQKNPFVSEEKASALGAALSPVLGKGLPSLRKEIELPPVVLKKALVVWGLALALGLVSQAAVNILTKKTLHRIQAQEVAVFKKYLPGQPVISPIRQLKALKDRWQSPKVSSTLAMVLKHLPAAVKIHAFSYQGGVLRFELEAPSKVKLEDLVQITGGELKVIREMPSGTREFSLEVSHGAS